MTGELRHEAKREQLATSIVPDEVIDRLCNDDVTDAELKTTDQFTQTHELYRTPITLPGVVGAQLSIQYRRMRKQFRHDYDSRSVIFNYGAVQSNVEAPVATLEFERVGERRYYLGHRYVEPAYRDRRGIGSQLLQQAEQLFQQLANRTGRRQRLEINLGQRSVLQWLLKNGYMAESRSREQVERIMHHPEEFVFHDIADLGDKIDRPDGIFPAGTTTFDLKNTVRVHLYKVIAQQRSADQRAAAAALLNRNASEPQQ